MTPAVHRWLEGRDLIMKDEFVTPSGYCDVVAVEFDETKIAARIKARQKKPIGSQSRVGILLSLPDEGSADHVRVADLLREVDSGHLSRRLQRDVESLIAGKFIVRSESGLQKRCSWLPLQKRIIAIELKLHRFVEVVRQAVANLSFADASYIAIPADIAERSYRHVTSIEEFVENGIGLLAVEPDNCAEIVAPRSRNHDAMEWLRVHCVERFWRTRSTGK